jgi:hypothetical protein
MMGNARAVSFLKVLIKEGRYNWCEVTSLGCLGFCFNDQARRKLPIQAPENYSSPSFGSSLRHTYLQPDPISHKHHTPGSGVSGLQCSSPTRASSTHQILALGIFDAPSTVDAASILFRWPRSIHVPSLYTNMYLRALEIVVSLGWRQHRRLTRFTAVYSTLSARSWGASNPGWCKF